MGIKPAVLILMTFLLAQIAYSETILPVYVKPSPTSASTLFNYTFNFSDSFDCSGAILSIQKNITTDSSGIGFAELNLSTISYMPNYMCEYRNGAVRKIHTMPDTYLRNLSAFTVKGLLDWSNITNVPSYVRNWNSTGLIIDWGSILNMSSYNTTNQLATLFVPYTGATSNVNLGVFDLTANNIYTSYIGGTQGSIDMSVSNWRVTGANVSFGQNIYAQNICYSNGTNCTASGGNSSFNSSWTDERYMSIGNASQQNDSVTLRFGQYMTIGNASQQNISVTGYINSLNQSMKDYVIWVNTTNGERGTAAGSNRTVQFNVNGSFTGDNFFKVNISTDARYPYGTNKNVIVYDAPSSSYGKLLVGTPVDYGMSAQLWVGDSVNNAPQNTMAMGVGSIYYNAWIEPYVGWHRIGNNGPSWTFGTFNSGTQSTGFLANPDAGGGLSETIGFSNSVYYFEPDSGNYPHFNNFMAATGGSFIVGATGEDGTAATTQLHGTISTDSSLGITDSTSYWLCTASDCSTRCQVTITNGLITGCV